MLTTVVGNMNLNLVDCVLDTPDKPMNISCQELMRSQHVQMQHVETRNRQLNIISRKNISRAI